MGESKRENLWILSRSPHLELALRNQLIAKGRELGFPVEQLIFTPQPSGEVVRW